MGARQVGGVALGDVAVAAAAVAAAVAAPPRPAAPERVRQTTAPLRPERPRRSVPEPLRLPRGTTGLACAGLLFSASVIPSLVPRPWPTQALVSGLALGLGYALGCLLAAATRPMRRRLRPDARQTASRVLLGVTVVLIPGWAWVLNHRWQDDLRGLMGIDPPAFYPLVVTGGALALGYVLVLLGRALGAARRAYVRAITRLVPRRARRTVHVIITALVVALVLAGVVAGRAIGAFKGAMAAADAAFHDDIAAPSSPARSGGPGSLTPWEGLGSTGRRFIAQGPDVAQLSAFNSAPALEPIRVYAGLASGDTVEERAALAVAELERTGAFERQVLAVITPTGTGRVNPLAIDPLEYLYNGDTAAVALQYSYYPSWVMLLTDQQAVTDSAVALFDAVTTRLEQQPPSSRPRLLLYGESLGAFGSESIFTDLDDIRARTDGALWVGPPYVNAGWRRLTDERDAGSPVWQPVYRQGALVRFGADGTALADPGPAWEAPRVAYLQHPSDPATWWSPSMALSRPTWMRGVRGADVSARMPYVPVATFLQVTVDLMLGAKAPVGHGHTFGPAQAEAWSLIAPPPGWTPHDTARLLDVIG